MELKIPPAALMLIVAGAMYLFSQTLPATHITGLARWIVGAILMLAGAFFCLAGVMRFRKANTTVNPMNPETSSTLVTRGIYAITRNPMYVGFLLMVVAWGFFLGNLFTQIFAVIFVLYMNRFQILPEERMLTRLFGDEYVAYTRRVRRWL